MKNIITTNDITQYQTVIEDSVIIDITDEEVYFKEYLPAYMIPVDLGLPSGKMWAKGNLGADNEEESGLYFQWGDTQGYTKEQIGNPKQFNWENYKWSVDGSSSNFSKYNSSVKHNLTWKMMQYIHH